MRIFVDIPDHICIIDIYQGLTHAPHAPDAIDKSITAYRTPNIADGVMMPHKSSPAKAAKVSKKKTGKAWDCDRNIKSALSALRRDEQITKHVLDRLNNDGTLYISPCIIAIDPRLHDSQTHQGAPTPENVIAVGYIRVSDIQSMFTELEAVLAKYVVDFDSDIHGDYLEALTVEQTVTKIVDGVEIETVEIVDAPPNNRAMFWPIAKDSRMWDLTKRGGSDRD